MGDLSIASHDRIFGIKTLGLGVSVELGVRVPVLVNDDVFFCA